MSLHLSHVETQNEASLGILTPNSAGDFRTLPTSAWYRLYQRFKPTLLSQSLPHMSNAGNVPHADFDACDFRILPTNAWHCLYQRFKPTLLSQSLPSTSTAGNVQVNVPNADFQACDFRTLPASAWRRLHQAFPEASPHERVPAAPPSFPLRPAPHELEERRESEEETEEETDDEVEQHAHPELGLRRSSQPTDPWRPLLHWLCLVIEDRLKAPLPPAQERQVRGLLPTGGLVSEKLSVNDLSDGRLLCALMVSVRPDLLPKANAVSLGRVAQFLKACAALGISKVSLFTPPDLLPEPSNPTAVLRCLQALAAVLQVSNGWTGPRLEGASRK
ncbi:unnamed protein product [Symbiodinium pilosum]|uniref:Calponin-homology (CH) domain-containing protein n=1 Tax=Symbiodinium pilosum TaxID=2952 RepID=A0A812M7E2_SYMPI|nr:unnamed protein product [Symbiodinium pilosum]